MFARISAAIIAIVFTLFASTSMISWVGSQASASDQHASGPLQRIVIGLDLSMSNPLVVDKVYAAKLGERVAAEIDGLSPRSEIWVRSFGVYDSSSNPLRFNEVISAKNRPEKVSKGIETLIANLPSLVDKGVIKSQAHTNILAFLQNMTQVVDCGSGMQTKFILLTDGIEDSEFANLRNANSHLPNNALNLTGQCYELQILGLGQGLSSPSETQRLRTEWANWATGDDSRPFTRFIGLNDW